MRGFDWDSNPGLFMEALPLRFSHINHFCTHSSAGLRIQSLPSSTPWPISLPAKITSLTSVWTTSPQNTAEATASPTSGNHSNSLLPVTSSTQTSPLPKNNSIDHQEEEVTKPASDWEDTSTGPSPPEFSPTSGGVLLTSSPTEHNLSTSETSVQPTGSQLPTESPTLISSQAPASSPSFLPTSPPEVPSASITTDHSSTVTTTKTPGTLTPSESPTEEHNSGHKPTSHATTGPMTKETTIQATVSTRVTCELIDIEITTASPGVIMEEVEHALSSGSIAAITVTVIAVVLLVFGVAAYLKIRHSSYGRLLDDHDYGSWGNYNNPLYDDS
ncbi:PREDICTED: prostate androgen-regulated mucin-like protein 1 homolog [Chrysochloris asiatica]|uniref:Prostate androgen-regulated mucin-like protein 1 homolog n=1 Tax=Chrysochloris asiatica TaxID=185453 RepID=A0A9B0TWI3_CHRAS|nr:PREDICTED: prostate androgen-regulated mucin-like protein 1 homolog [Chrysochloris asiatica]